ncbi:unnamed protein product, partial [Dicrocoelium dendriticum]
MHRNRKSQANALPRGSQYIDGQLIHTATNQKLFFNTHVCTVYREILKPSEPFLKTTAEHVMNKHTRKRQAHGTANILEDRFTIEPSKSGGKTPFRPYLYYREIQDIQRSKKKPEYFVLSILSEKSDKRYYEVYKCKGKEEASRFENYVRGAMNDPEKMVRDPSYIGVVPVSQTDDLRRSLANVVFEEVPSSEEEEDEDHTVKVQKPDTTYVEKPRVRESIPPPMLQTQPAVHAVPVQSASRSPKLSTRSSSFPSELPDVTCIYYEWKTGRPVINENGPFYMYCMRTESEYNQSPYGARKGQSMNDGMNYSPSYNSTYRPYQSNERSATRDGIISTYA